MEVMAQTFKPGDLLPMAYWPGAGKLYLFAPAMEINQTFSGKNQTIIITSPGPMADPVLTPAMLTFMLRNLT